MTWILRGACAALLLPFIPPLVTGRIFVTGDLQAFHLPYRYLYASALASGDSPLWTSAIFSGFYVHGEGQAGLLHPVHFLLYRFLSLQLAFNLELLANYLFALPGMYVFLRRLALDASAALFGAMLFAFSGVALLHHEHLNLVAVVAHLPWLLVAADMIFTAPTRAAIARGYAALVAVMVSEVLLGFPQGVWWNVVTLAAFLLFRLRATRRYWRAVAVAGALATSLLIGAIQVLPTAEVSDRSIRVLLTRDFALSFSLHPLNLLQLWSPYAFTQRVFSARDVALAKELGIYSGAILLVALPWLWIRWRELRDRRPLIIGALLFAALNLVLALGYYGGLYTALTYLPVLGSMRAPVRYIVLVDFALAVSAAIVFDDLLSLQRARGRIDPARLRPLWIPATLSVLTTLIFNTRLFPVLTRVPFSPGWRALAGTMLMIAVTASVAFAARARRWALPALVMLTVLDLALWGHREVWREPPRTIESLTAAAEPPTSEFGRETLFKSTFDFPGNLLVLRGYRLSSGYMALPPATYYHLSSVISKQLSGTVWDYTETGRERLSGAVDRARLVADARVTHEFWRDFALVDLHKTALVDRDVPPLAGPPGVARVIVDRPGYIVVDTSAPGRQLLALTERHHPGWHADADGRPLEMVAIHGDFVGCVVDAGAHRVEFRFVPQSFVTGAWVSGAGVLVFAVTLGFLLRPRRARAAPLP